jgi:hypothetical protein
MGLASGNHASWDESFCTVAECFLNELGALEIECEWDAEQEHWQAKDRGKAKVTTTSAALDPWFDALEKIGVKAKRLDKTTAGIWDNLIRHGQQLCELAERNRINSSAISGFLQERNPERIPGAESVVRRLDIIERMNFRDSIKAAVDRFKRGPQVLTCQIKRPAAQRLRLFVLTGEGRSFDFADRVFKAPAGRDSRLRLGPASTAKETAQGCLHEASLCLSDLTPREPLPDGTRLGVFWGVESGGRYSPVPPGEYDRHGYNLVVVDGVPIPEDELFDSDSDGADANVETGGGERAATLEKVTARAWIISHGGGLYSLGNSDKVQVTPREDEMLKAFLDSQTLHTADIVDRTGIEQPVDVLKQLRKRNGGIFATAIDFAGRKGNGYTVRVKPSDT